MTRPDHKTSFPSTVAFYNIKVHLIDQAWNVSFSDDNLKLVFKLLLRFDAFLL